MKVRFQTGASAPSGHGRRRDSVSLTGHPVTLSGCAPGCPRLTSHHRQPLRSGAGARSAPGSAQSPAPSWSAASTARPGRQRQALLPGQADHLLRRLRLSRRLRPHPLRHVVQCRGHHGTSPAKPPGSARSGRKHQLVESGGDRVCSHDLQGCGRGRSGNTCRLRAGPRTACALTTAAGGSGSREVC